MTAEQISAAEKHAAQYGFDSAEVKALWEIVLKHAPQMSIEKLCEVSATACKVTR
jgi:hypothetical protein